MIRLLLAFLAVWNLSIGADAPEPEKKEPVEAGYLGASNPWLGIYKNRRNYESLEKKIAALSARLEETGPGPVRDGLRDELALLEAEKSLYENLPRSFEELLTGVVPADSAGPLNLATYMSGASLRSLDRAGEKLARLEEEYARAVEHLERYGEKAGQALAAASGKEKKELEAFAAKVRRDQRYFELGRKLLEKQRESLRLRRNLAQEEIHRFRETELVRFFLAGGVTVALFIFLWVGRFTVNRHVKDEERQFFYKKVMNLGGLLFLVILWTLMFIENLLYALTILGFIGAALTIVLKEALLNFAGWVSLIFSNAIREGDRILMLHETKPIIGDVIHISFTKIVLYEGVNHNTTLDLKRAGRVVFIPNNYIFTHTVFNYSHESMKTILDLIEVDLKMESDFDAVLKTADETVRRVAGAHIGEATRQYRGLKRKYDMRQRDFEPKIHLLVSEDRKAMTLYVWYPAPYQEVMNIRSRLAGELVKGLAATPGVVLSGMDKEKSG